MEEFQPNGLSRENGGSSGGAGSLQSGDGFRRPNFNPMAGNEGSSGDGGGGYGSIGGSQGQMHSGASLSFQQFLANGGGASAMNSMMTNGTGSMAGNLNGGGGMSSMMAQGYGLGSMSNAGMRNNFATSSMQQFGADGNSGMMSGQDRRRSSSSSIGGTSGMPSQAMLNQMVDERLEKLQMIQRLRAQIAQNKLEMMGGGFGGGGGGFGGGGGVMGAGSTGNMSDSYYAGIMAGFGTGVNANSSGTTSSQKNFPETLFGEIDDDGSFVH